MCIDLLSSYFLHGIQFWLETDKAAYLLRQYFFSNLHDRLSTRPFLSLIEKKWLAFQVLLPHLLNKLLSINECEGLIFLALISFNVIGIIICNVLTLKYGLPFSLHCFQQFHVIYIKKIKQYKKNVISKIALLRIQIYWVSLKRRYTFSLLETVW